MAKAKTTGKATKKAIRTGNVSNVAAKSMAKKAAAAKPRTINPSAAKSEAAKVKTYAKNTAGGKIKTTDKIDIDRRATAAERRNESDRRKNGKPVAVERRKIERRAKVNRRRQIDPTTCERDYTNDELEFMNALDEYKRSSGRMFPTCSEVLEVIMGLGYEKRPQGEIAAVNPQENATQQVDMPLDFEEYEFSERVVF